MAQITKTQIQTLIDDITDGGNNTAAEVRTLLTNFKDSFQHLDDVVTADVLSTVLTGFMASAGTVDDTDTLLSALNEIVANIQANTDAVSANASAISDNTTAITNSTSAAAGPADLLEQKLLANDGQVGLNVLAVGLTNTGRVQGVSLGDGNVVTVYASGTDFTNNVVLYREFMALGEPIIFSGLAAGAIITSTQGFYGVCEVLIGNGVSTMPLMSLGLAITDTFMFSFRNSNRSNNSNAFIFIVNGPVTSTVQAFFGDGSPISDQPSQTLDPWEFGFIRLDGDVEYRIQATNPVMLCTACAFNNGDPNSTANPASTAAPFDARLILPVTNDLIVHPRSGFVSAIFDGTIVNWFDMNGEEGVLNNGVGFGPNAPVDADIAPPTGTGNTQTDHNPLGYTRMKAIGLISSYSGADGAGGDAVPACPVSAMSQILAQPLYINDSGNGDNTSVTIYSPYEGTAKIFAWNDATGVAELAYTIPLIRNNVTITTADDQNHPAAGQLTNQGGTGRVTMVGNLAAGYIIADVPISAVVQSDLTNAVTIRAQNGTTENNIRHEDDETLVFGITPDELRAEIRRGDDDLLYRRVIAAGGADSWVLV